MSADEIYRAWFLWLAIGGVLVVAAAALLVTILALAHRIARLAATALTVCGEIEQQTKPIWQLAATNQVAGRLEHDARNIGGNAERIAAALSGSRP
jgi:hypothetical protein